MSHDDLGLGYDPAQASQTIECAKCPPSPVDRRRAVFIDDPLGRRAHVRTMGHRPESLPADPTVRPGAVRRSPGSDTHAQPFPHGDQGPAVGGQA